MQKIQKCAKKDTNCLLSMMLGECAKKLELLDLNPYIDLEVLKINIQLTLEFFCLGLMYKQLGKKHGTQLLYSDITECTKMERFVNTFNGGMLKDDRTCPIDLDLIRERTKSVFIAD